MFSSNFAIAVQFLVGAAFFGLCLHELTHFLGKQDMRQLNRDPFTAIFGDHGERFAVAALVVIFACIVYAMVGTPVLAFIHITGFAVYWLGMIGIYHRVTSVQKRGQYFRA